MPCTPVQALRRETDAIDGTHSTWGDKSKPVELAEEGEEGRGPSSSPSGASRCWMDVDHVKGAGTWSSTSIPSSGDDITGRKHFIAAARVRGGGSHSTRPPTKRQAHAFGSFGMAPLNTSRNNKLHRAAPGQSIHQADGREQKGWHVIRGMRGVRRKPGGQGGTVSAPRDELPGRFGFPLAEAQLDNVDASRRGRKRSNQPALEASPTKAAVHASNRFPVGAGTWRSQAVAVMHCLGPVEPRKRFVLEYLGRSAGHPELPKGGFRVRGHEGQARGEAQTLTRHTRGGGGRLGSGGGEGVPRCRTAEHTVRQGSKRADGGLRSSGCLRPNPRC